MRNLKELLKIYELKHKNLTLSGPKMEIEDGTDCFTGSTESLKHLSRFVEENSTVKAVSSVEEVKEGDVIEVIPSVDGNNLYFLVLGKDDEMDLVRAVLLSEFIEFCTPDDVIISVEDFEIKGNTEKFLAEAALWLDIPFSYAVEKSLKFFKVGKISPSDLNRVIAVHFGKGKGDNPFLTPSKRKFKELETQRCAVFLSRLLP